MERVGIATFGDSADDFTVISSRLGDEEDFVDGFRYGEERV